MNRLICILAALGMTGTAGQEAQFTSQFQLEGCHFSIFGGTPYSVLNPGHQLVLQGEEAGERIVLTITPINETKEITLQSGDTTRKILTRVVEEQERTNGELTEISRYWYARCIESGDIYYFGEEVEFYEDGVRAGRTRLWEAGVDGALPGIIMPRTFMLGARYVQNQAPTAFDQAENTAMAIAAVTPAGTFQNCIQIRESNALRPEDRPAVKTYAPGIGLINDEDILKLTEFRLGTVGLPSGCTFVPFSNHPYFPFAPGRRLILEGMDGGEQLIRTVTTLDATREFALMVDGEEQTLPARLIEERQTANGRLVEVSRRYFAQCIETGDVYWFGNEVDHYEDGVIVGHTGSWLAGSANAQAGIIMPGNTAVGGQYVQEMAPGSAITIAVTSAAGIRLTVPAGTFSSCIRVIETKSPGSSGLIERIYAPAIGLIDERNTLKLTSLIDPNAGASNAPILSIQNAILLRWPLTEQPFILESSMNLRIWTPVSRASVPMDGQNQISVPRGKALEYFRLSAP